MSGGWGWAWDGEGGGIIGIGQGAAATLFYDTFTDANGTALTAHTPDIDTVGGGWIHVLDTWQIDANKAEPASESVAPWPFAWADCGVSDAVVTCNVEARNWQTGMGNRVVVCGVDVDNFVDVGIELKTGTFYIQEAKAGPWTILASTVPTPALVNGQVYTIEVTISGASVVATLDGGNQISATMTITPGTKFGLSSRDVGTGNQAFDEFKVVG